MKTKLGILLLVFVLVSPVVLAGEIEDALDGVAQARDDLTDARQAWRDVQPVNIFDEEERTAGFELMKDVWVKQGTLSQKKLELSKARVNARPRIDQELKDEINNGADELIDKIEDWKTDIAASENFGEFFQTLKEVKDLWREFVWKTRKYFGLTVLGHLDTALERGQELREKLAEHISFLGERDRDTGELPEILADIDSNLETVESKLQEARDKIENIDTFDDSAKNFREAREILAEGKTAARTVLRKFREAREEIRSLRIAAGTTNGGGEE